MNRVVGLLKKPGGLHKHVTVDQINSKFCPCDFSNIMQQVDIEVGIKTYGFLFPAQTVVLGLWQWKVNQKQEGNYFIPGFLNSI